MITRRYVGQLALITAGYVLTSPEAGTAEATSPVSETGPLDAPTLDILMATAEAVIGSKPLRGNYAAYYGYQSLHRPGHRAIYCRFANEISRAVRGATDPFVVQSIAERLEVTNAIRGQRRLAAHFEIPIFQETLAVFMKTDAWIKLGYLAWPGTPRGVGSYQVPFTNSGFAQ
jgi:hypothetical protein